MVTTKLLEYVFQEHEEYPYALSQPSPRWLFNGLTPANAVYSRIITERCPIVFAILPSVSRPGRIFDFVEADLEDTSLPLQPVDVLDFCNAGRIFITNQHKWLIATSLCGRHRNLQPGETDPYFLEANLGRGPHGQVYVGQPKISTDYPQSRVCIKRLFRPLDNSTEGEFLKDLDHRHLVKFLGSYNLEGLTSIITSPVCDMNVAEFLHEKPHGWIVENMMGRAVQWMHCLSSAVKYLHDAKFYHHNLKPSNIPVLGQQLFITDFGVSVGPPYPDEPGSKRYAAPELAFPAEDYAGSAADVFSLACIFADVAISSLGLTPSTLWAWEASNYGTGALFCKNLAVAEKILEGVLGFVHARKVLTC